MRRKSRWAAALTVCAGVPAIVALASLVASAQEDSDFAKAVANQLGYSDAEIQKVFAGEFVSHQMRDESKKELALTAALLLPISAEVVFADMQSRSTLEIDRTIHAMGAIEKFPASAASFAKLVISDAELDLLLNARPGSKVNLAEEEIITLQATAKRLRGQSKAQRRSAIMQAYRELLAVRVEAYRNAGLAGIPAYDRGRRDSFPAEDLKDAIPAADSPIALKSPEFYRRLKEKPIDATFRGDAGGVEDRFIWLLQEFNGREAVVLAHRVLGLDAGNTFLAQRDFYVSHTFDALQILAGALPHGPNKSILIYGNLTYTEQVAGFGSSAAHAIGRKMMAKEVRTLFAAIQASFPSEK